MIRMAINAVQGLPEEPLKAAAEVADAVPGFPSEPHETLSQEEKKKQ